MGCPSLEVLKQRYEKRERLEKTLDFPPELKKRISDFCDISPLLERVRKQFKANVTLDPDTAHPKLILSEDGKSVRWGEKPQALPDNPERFRRYSCVLGREGFTTGSHFWEVTVKSGEYWALGVARKSVERKGSFSLSFLDFCPCPEGGIWAVGKSGGKYWAYSSPFPSPLSLSEEPRRIRVTLDCEGGHVSFYAADSGAELYTFSGASFSGETLLPFFLLWENYKIWDLLRRIS
ncbi:finger RFP-like [Podarcis lilfordi]|uniref:Finger RFP-like n=1 Tax=Podarcis lilfordi TaxID=74358 RepID=A0AA35JYB3_9SAUR|nr:finger RFP-like [Podarcis lilfordi]